MSDERDEILDELGVLLSIEPSAGFDTRVKREVAQRAGRWVWWPWVAVAGVAVFALMLVVRERPGVDPDVRALATAVTGTPDVSRRRSDDSTPVPHVERQRTASAVTRPAATRVIEPEVLVPRENARAFALLVSAARRGEIPSLVKAGEAVDTALAAALVPIEVPPFEIPLAIRPAGDEGL